MDIPRRVITHHIYMSVCSRLADLLTAAAAVVLISDTQTRAHGHIDGSSRCAAASSPQIPLPRYPASFPCIDWEVVRSLAEDQCKRFAAAFSGNSGSSGGVAPDPRESCSALATVALAFQLQLQD